MYQSRRAYLSADLNIHLRRNSLIQVYISSLLFLSNCDLHFSLKEKYVIWCVYLVALKVGAVVRVVEVNNNNNNNRDVLYVISYCLFRVFICCLLFVYFPIFPCALSFN